MDTLTALIPLIAEHLEIPEGSFSAKVVHGGSINQCYQLKAGDEMYFCKVNSSRMYPGMFEAERVGLNTIATSNTIKVPSCKGILEKDEQQCLLLEWIEPGNPSIGFWRSFGELLAKMHSLNQPEPGFDSDNYIGSLRQINKSQETWIGFFVQQRLRVQVSLAANNNLLDKRDLDSFERLYRQVGELFPDEPNVLLHGDLWSGNFMCDLHDQPVIFDPAVYFGSRHADLAMTTLFGGFHDSFYQAYAYYVPLPANYVRLWQVLNLYPLLVHLNLFGIGYRRPILNVLKHF